MSDIMITESGAGSPRYRLLGSEALTASAPASGGITIVPDDDNDLESVPRGVYVGVGGSLSVIMKDDEVAITLLNVANGALLPISPRRILVSGTTAQNIIALY